MSYKLYLNYSVTTTASTTHFAVSISETNLIKFIQKKKKTYDKMMQINVYPTANALSFELDIQMLNSLAIQMQYKDL